MEEDPCGPDRSLMWAAAPIVDNRRHVLNESVHFLGHKLACYGLPVAEIGGRSFSRSCQQAPNGTSRVYSFTFGMCLAKIAVSYHSRSGLSQVSSFPHWAILTWHGAARHRLHEVRRANMRLEKLVGRTGHDERSCVQGRTERAHSCPGTRPRRLLCETVRPTY